MAGCDRCRINHDIRWLKVRVVAVNVTTPMAGLTALHTVLILAAPGVFYPWFSVAVFAALALVPTGVLSHRGRGFGKQTNA